LVWCAKDTNKHGVSEYDELFNRDYGGATLEDHFDKSSLPAVCTHNRMHRRSNALMPIVVVRRCFKSKSLVTSVEPNTLICSIKILLTRTRTKAGVLTLSSERSTWEREPELGMWHGHQRRTEQVNKVNKLIYFKFELP